MMHDTKPPVDIFELRSDLPQSVGETIMRCLATNPSGRPQTAEEFVRGVAKRRSPASACSAANVRSPGFSLFGSERKEFRLQPGFHASLLTIPNKHSS